MLTFKILVIQTINTLSDERTEYLINDWLSFMRFLGLGLSDRVPDAKTIWLFRERLTKAGAIAALFEHFDRTLREAGYIPMSGQIVNASLVATPRRRNTNAEKADIKAGRIPEHWKNNPAKLRHKDRDTRWTLKFTKANRWRMARCRQSISPFRPFGYIRARFLVHLSDFTTDHSPAGPFGRTFSRALRHDARRRRLFFPRGEDMFGINVRGSASSRKFFATRLLREVV